MPAAVSHAASSLLEALRAFEPEEFSGRDCGSLAERLAVVEKACAAARARAAARAAKCGAHRELGFADASDWLARATGSARGAARAELETAEALDGIPEAKDAALAGELSLNQAKEITRTATEQPESTAELLALAKTTSLQSLRDEGRRRRLCAVDPNETRRRQLAAREFRHWLDDTGMVRFSGALPPETGIPFVNRVDAECDRVRRAARRAGSREGRVAHAADAFVALVNGNGMGRARAADLVIVCDVRAWRRGHVHEGETCHILGGGPVPVELARELGRDAFLKAVLHDGVAVHTVAHFGRHIKAELRTALELGPLPRLDGVACADGCGSRYGLEWDHVDPLANHGPTAVDNLEPRCWSCHHEKTERDRRAGLLGGAGNRRAPP